MKNSELEDLVKDFVNSNSEDDVDEFYGSSRDRAKDTMAKFETYLHNSGKRINFSIEQRSRSDTDTKHRNKPRNKS